MVARLTVLLQSWVQIRRLPSPQMTVNLLVGWHLGWHLAVGWPLWGATEEKIMRNELLVCQITYKEKNIIIIIGQSKHYLTIEVRGWHSQNCNLQIIPKPLRSLIPHIPHWLWVRYVPHAHDSSTRTLGFIGKLTLLSHERLEQNTHLSGPLTAPASQG